MNQTKKRLTIINLAISMTDIETIQLQILKLGPLKSDAAIQEIIAALQAENYIRAQSLIGEYIEGEHEEILQRTSQKEKEDAITDTFDLFDEDESKAEGEIEVIDLDEMMKFHQEATQAQAKRMEDPSDQEKNSFDTLLNLDKEEVMADNISIDISHKQEDSEFWQVEEIALDTQEVPRDTFFDQEIIDKEIIDQKIIDKETSTPEPLEAESNSHDNTPSKSHIDIETLEIHTIDDIFDKPASTVTQEESKEPLPYNNDDIYEILTLKEDEEESSEGDATSFMEEEDSSVTYKPIPYIDQKFKNMQVQYPPTEISLEHFDRVNALLLKIANDGYSEQEVEEMMQTIDTLTTQNKDEAAQLMLILGATESKYAQFRLARALFKGEILKKNLPEAFTIINRLAVNDDYPEAICDLAQFYEYGIGISKDKKRAEQLYKEAMEEGIQRAAAHYERLKKENRSLFSFLKK